MTRLTSKMPRSQGRTNVEDEVRETGPLPIALFGVVVLLLGDVALTLAPIAAMG